MLVNLFVPSKFKRKQGKVDEVTQSVKGKGLNQPKEDNMARNKGSSNRRRALDNLASHSIDLGLVGATQRAGGSASKTNDIMMLIIR